MLELDKFNSSGLELIRLSTVSLLAKEEYNMGMKWTKEQKKEWNEGIIERLNYELYDPFNPTIRNRNIPKDFQIAATVGCTVAYVRNIKQLL